MLVDAFGRRSEYLTRPVTYRCDLRYAYCTPAGFKDYKEPAHWLALVNAHPLPMWLLTRKRCVFQQ